MHDFFIYEFVTSFKTFSSAHIYIMLLTLLFWIGGVLVIKIRNESSESSDNRVFRYSVAFLLIFLEVANTVWRIATGHFSIADSLPLHLCGITTFTCAFMLIYENFSLFEFNYFIGLGGAIQAIITPDELHAFPHFDCIQHFFSHALIIMSVLYMVFIRKNIPSLFSPVKVFIITNIYLVGIYFFNFFTGGNYLFVSRPPSTPSLIDYFIKIFGPHPWYIIGMELFAVITFTLLSLPFFFARLFSRNNHMAKGLLS